ncbi:hypothetical protein [Candidatus Coxiella mudrowiae]|uniref:Transposase n=1 Tax=Candidatus Coxiella mudrowiae TaxID=2054173 RepID=A0ABN4HP55_9COXI|nr:hypothetical protein [Candidatus Coxiella mudrowiae]AKQ33442.1 hypothetical protein CleRT_05370 [Candidatus Coxiella mudrowiae]AKQ33529.1 hypothetical protein CleRT_06810 [Candidatus Coxiella mudrowiae]
MEVTGAKRTGTSKVPLDWCLINREDTDHQTKIQTLFDYALEQYSQLPPKQLRGKKEIALFREKILRPLLEHGSQVRPKVLKVIKLDWKLLDLILGFIYTTAPHPYTIAMRKCLRTYVQES